MRVPLSPHGEELLRHVDAQLGAGSLGLVAAGLLDEGLLHDFGRGLIGMAGERAFHAWLDQFTGYSDRIPFLPGETFSRAMIYQDHD